MNLEQLTFRLSDDEEWYKERMSQCKFVITASVGIFALLVLSPDKLPTGAAEDNWWLYRIAASSAGFTAVFSTVYYFFCFRMRFLIKFMSEVSDQEPASILVKIYISMFPWRRKLEVFGYWISYSLAFLGFLATMLFGALFVLCAIWPMPG